MNQSDAFFRTNLSPGVVWVVVVCYNGGDWLRKCLESLQASSLPVRVVVLDNGSEDGSIQLIETRFPEVTLIRNPENVGFGRANNEGIRLAFKGGAEYVFLLNQDAWVEPDTLQQLTEQSRLHPEYGLLSPAHLNADGTTLDHGFANYVRADRCPGFISDAYLRQLKPIYSLPFVNAAAWLLTRACLEKTGGFNPMFFMYGEDLDYSQRVLFHRLRIGIVPGARIFHARSNALPATAPRPARWEGLKQQSNDLAALNNINRSIAIQFGSFAAQTVYALVSHPVRLFPAILLSKWNVLKRLPEVMSSRRQGRKPGPTFID
jgi:glycosyltransferase involved in cell wall biosynthesis